MRDDNKENRRESMKLNVILACKELIWLLDIEVSIRIFNNVFDFSWRLGPS